MTTKLINRESSKIKRELILELSRSILDTAINIQQSLNEDGHQFIFPLFLSPVILVESLLKERNPLNLLK